MLPLKQHFSMNHEYTHSHQGGMQVSLSALVSCRASASEVTAVTVTSFLQMRKLGDINHVGSSSRNLYWHGSTNLVEYFAGGISYTVHVSFFL